MQSFNMCCRVFWYYLSTTVTNGKSKFWISCENRVLTSEQNLWEMLAIDLVVLTVWKKLYVARLVVKILIVFKIMKQKLPPGGIIRLWIKPLLCIMMHGSKEIVLFC